MNPEPSSRRSRSRERPPPTLFHPSAEETLYHPSAEVTCPTKTTLYHLSAEVTCPTTRYHPSAEATWRHSSPDGPTPRPSHRTAPPWRPCWGSWTAPRAPTGYEPRDNRLRATRDNRSWSGPRAPSRPRCPRPRPRRHRRWSHFCPPSRLCSTVPLLRWGRRPPPNFGSGRS